MGSIAPIARADPAPQGVILCADDYGLSQGVSDAIVSLAKTARISATSALVNLPRWPADAAALRECRANTALGLHFNLTLGRPLGAMPRLAPSGALPPLSRMLRLSWAGGLDNSEIAEEATNQIAAFELAIGAPPDFVDGHQHVHVLPGIRTILLDLLATRYPRRNLLVRDPTDRFSDALRRPARAKALFVAGLAWGFADQAARRGLVVNSGFSGFSSFRGRRSYAEEFDRYLIGAGRGHLIMCHPGLMEPDLGQFDTLGEFRRAEFEILARREDIPNLIWRPNRKGGEFGCDWPITHRV
jgi:predicted glycoside hydrolase/deacetylase ChbG (UPF0249 family)